MKDHNDSEVLDDGLKAKLFNQYFGNIGKEIAKSFPEENQSILRHIYRVTSPTCSTVEIEICNITKSLGKIKANKAAGLDNVSSTIIPLSGTAIVEGLTSVFKSSFVSRSMPHTWKRAKDIPIFKKGSKSDIDNYRPFSSLSIPSKILEHQVCDILDDHLSKHSLKKSSTMGLCKRPLRKECSCL